jgi:hypothetical protein
MMSTMQNSFVHRHVHIKKANGITKTMEEDPPSHPSQPPHPPAIAELPANTPEGGTAALCFAGSSDRHFSESSTTDHSKNIASSTPPRAVIAQTHGEHGTPNSQEHTNPSVDGIGMGGKCGFGVEGAEDCFRSAPSQRIISKCG